MYCMYGVDGTIFHTAISTGLSSSSSPRNFRVQILLKAGCAAGVRPFVTGPCVLARVRACLANADEVGLDNTVGSSCDCVFIVSSILYRL